MTIAADSRQSEAHEVIITRIFDAPRELMFKPWPDPKHMARWWGPKGFTNPYLRNGREARRRSSDCHACSGRSRSYDERYLPRDRGARAAGVSLERLAEYVTRLDGTPMARAVDPNLELVLTRVFNAPRALVFKAWTDRRHAKNWWGPRDYPATHLEMDVRPGGVWRGWLRSQESGKELRHGGVFREVKEPAASSSPSPGRKMASAVLKPW